MTPIPTQELRHPERKPMKTQLDILERLITRKRGVTAMEICSAVGTVAPHKRLSELKRRGWSITRKPVPGCNFGRYFGEKVG